jgi:signal transduction histidine kinase
VVIKVAGAAPLEGKSAVSDLVSASIIRHRVDIVSGFLGSLQQLESPLINDRALRQALRAQVAWVLEDTVAVLRGDPQNGVPQRPDRAGVSIGVQCARRGIHPAEPVRAASVLFEIALDKVARDLGAAPQSVESLTRYCVALHNCIARRSETVARAHFAALVDRLHSSYAEQRIRLSRDLHDHAAQAAAVALRNLELYEVHRMADPPRARADLAATKVHIKEAMDAIRGLSTGLRSPEVRDGLHLAVVRYLATAAPWIVTSVTVTGAESHLPVRIRGELFLVLREAIGNALRHANPRTVEVDVAIGGGRVTAAVTDDGCGFDTVPALSTPIGAGLLSMAERTRAVGGTLGIDSRPGHGTTVRARIPLPRQRS